MDNDEQISIEELRNHIKNHGAAIASNIIFLFDDYGNVQLLKKSEDANGFFSSCIFTHVPKIDHSNPACVLTFSLGKFLTGEYIREFQQSLQVYNEWKTVSRIQWIRENHRN